MRVERKRRGKTFPDKWHQGQMGPLQFDGYALTVHFTAEDGSDVRVSLERNEAEALAAYIGAELSKQRSRVKALTQAYAVLSEPESTT